MTRFARFLLTMVLALAPMIGLGQSTSFYTDRAVGTFPGARGGVTNLIPIQFGQVRVCTAADIGGATSPCPDIAPISDILGNPLTVVGGNFGQIKTDVVGRFSFGCASGTSYLVQVAASSSNVPQLSYPITCSPNFTLTNLIPTNNTWTGINNFGTLTVQSANNVIKCDKQPGSSFDIVMTNCINALPATGPGIADATNLSGAQLTMTGNLTISRSGTWIPFGQNTVAMSTNQIIVPNGVFGVYLSSTVPFGGGGFNSTNGARFTYTGSGKAFQIGNNTSTDRTFNFEDITIDLTGAGSGATGMYMTNVVYFTLFRVSVINGSATTGLTGITCDGTGNFCGNGSIINPYFNGLATAFLGTNGANAVVIHGGAIGCQTGGTGVDLEISDSNVIDAIDIESCNIGAKFGSSANGNYVRMRQEVNTTDFQALAGSNQNVGIVERANNPIVSDAGTKNHFYRMQDGDFEHATIDNIQARSGSSVAMLDGTLTTQAAVLNNAFEVFHTFVLAPGVSIQDAPTGTRAGVSSKVGSGAGNYTGTNTGYANVDTTNLCLALTVPTGWKLVVSADATIESVTAAVQQNFSLSDVGTTCGGAGVTPLNGSEKAVTPPAVGTFDIALHLQAVVNGDGAVHSVSMQAKTSNAADAWGIQNTSSSSAPSMIWTLTPSN